MPRNARVKRASEEETTEREARPQQPEPRAPKKPYVPPRLDEYGPVASLTADDYKDD